MLDWSEYSSFQHRSKCMAVQAFIGELMINTKALTVYQLPINLEALINEEEQKNFIQKKANQRFFYKKYNGQRIKEKESVEVLARIIPGSDALLSHPLWEFLGPKQPSEIKVINLAKKLNPALQLKILTTDGLALKQPKNIYKLLRGNTYDALAATLLVLHKYYESLSLNDKNIINQSLLKFILRFFIYRNKKLAFTVIQKVIAQLKLHHTTSEFSPSFTIQDEKTYTEKTINNFPLTLQQITSPKVLNHAFDSYTLIYQQLSKLNLFQGEVLSLSEMMTYIEHEQLDKLCSEILNSPNIMHLDLSSQLGTLTAYIRSYRLLDDFKESETLARENHEDI